MNEGKVIFNGKSLALEDFYSKNGLEKIEQELAQTEVSLFEEIFMPNAWATPLHVAAIAFAAVAVLLGLIAGIYYMADAATCGPNSSNKSFLESVDRTAKCCLAVEEYSDWRGNIDGLGKQAAKAECGGSEFDKLSGMNSCDTAIANYAYPPCKEGNRDILDQLSECVQKAQAILDIKYLGGCQLPTRESFVDPISGALKDAISQ